MENPVNASDCLAHTLVFASFFQEHLSLFPLKFISLTFTHSPDVNFYQNSSKNSSLTPSLSSPLTSCPPRGLLIVSVINLVFDNGSVGKESACNAEDTGDVGSIPTGRSGEGNGYPPPAFLPRESYGEQEPGRLHSIMLQTDMTEVTKHNSSYYYYCWYCYYYYYHHT